MSNPMEGRMTIQELADENPEALLLDGFEAAFVGVARRCGQPSLAVYDAGLCIRVLMERDGMTEDDAVEFFDFNTAGAWVGPNTPVILERSVDSRLTVAGESA